MFQIHGALRAGNGDERAERYRRRVAAFCADGGRVRLERMLERTFGPGGTEALVALMAGDMKAFAARMTRAKVAFFAGFAVRHPLVAARALSEGIVDHARLYRTRQCGFVLDVYAAGEGRWHDFLGTLDALKAANILYAWTDADSGSRRISRRERRVMERGGLAVKRSSKAGAAIDLDALPALDVSASVMEALIGRHRALFLRKGGAA